MWSCFIVVTFKSINKFFIGFDSIKVGALHGFARRSSALSRNHSASPISRFEFAPGYARLANNRQKCADVKFGMGWNRDGNCGIGQALLHNNMASALSHLKKSMMCQDCTNLVSGENSELTQRQPPAGSHTLPHEGAT